MGNGSSGSGRLSEDEVREIVREELQKAASSSTTRRRLLGTLGAIGVAGLAGCGSDDERQTSEPAPTTTATDTATRAEETAPATPADDSTFALQDDGTSVVEDVRTLNFRKNLVTSADGDFVSVDAKRGVDVVGSEADSNPITSIELGPGLDASVDAGTLTVSRIESQQGSGAYLARPGDLQSALDDAVEDGVGRVSLVGGRTYELSSPIDVPPAVSLDCTGARVAIAEDVDGFVLHSQSQVRQPHVRTTDVDGYSSSIFKVDPVQFGGSFGTDRPVPVWSVSGGFSEMTPGEGTCIELRGVRENPDGDYNVQRDNRNVYFCFVAHNCTGGYRYAYLHRDGGTTTRGGHVNGNVIQGFADNTTRFVETDDTASGKNMVNGNKFYLATQPGPESEWLWYANKGTRNELYEWGTNWDYARYSDSDGDGYPESWYIGPNAGQNYVWRKVSGATGGLASTVMDESGGDSGSRYLLLDRLGVPVHRLNRWEGAE